MEALFTLSYLTFILDYFRFFLRICLPLFTALCKSSHHLMDKVFQFHVCQLFVFRPSQYESCSRVEAISGTLSTSCVSSQSCVFWVVSTCFRNRRFAPAQPNTSSSCVLRRQIAVLTMRRDKVTSSPVESNLLHCFLISMVIYVMWSTTNPHSHGLL